MSFICKTCGAVENYRKQTKVPTKIRDVEYNLQVKTIYADGESTKIVRRVTGTEIVAEVFYCTKHIPENMEPIKTEKVTRDQIIKTILIRKNNEEVEEEENSKRNEYSKDKKDE